MHESIGHREPRGQVMLLLLFIALVFAVPIRLLIPVPGPEFRRGLVCATELVFVLPYILSLARRENFVVLSPVAGVLFVAWLIAAMASVTMSPHWMPAAARQMEWICHILFAASVWHFLRGNRTLVRWVLVFVIAGVLATALIVFRASYMAGADGSISWRQYLPLFTHIRHFGYYALAGVVLAQLWGADEQAGVWRLVSSAVALSVLWGAVIWTGGRGAVASAFMGVACVVILSSERRRVLIGLNTVALSVGSVIAEYVSGGRPDLGWYRLLTRMDANGMEQFATGRLRFWELAFDRFREHPVFGLGPDAYRYLEPKIFGSHPHNVILQFLTDYGTVGTVLFGLMLVILIMSVVKRVVDRRADLRSERVVAISLVLALIAHSLLDGTFYHALPLMVLGTAMAVGLLPEAYAGSGSSNVGLISVRTGLAGATATVLACFFAVYAVLLMNFLTGPIPRPNSTRAQLVRQLPFVTHSLALEQWIRVWSMEDLDVAVDWAHWAHSHSPDAYRFSGLEARLLMDQGLYEAARDHALQAVESTSGRMRLAMTESLKPIIDAADANSDQLLFQVDGD